MLPCNPQPPFPASGLDTGSLNGLNRKSKFLAFYPRNPLSIYPVTYSQKYILILEITLIQVCITLIILKLFGLISWSWIAVLYLPMVLIGLPLVVVLSAVLLMWVGYALVCMVDPIYIYIVKRIRNRDEG